MEMADIKAIAVEGAKQLRDNAARLPGTDWRFEYSPETFSTAELDFSIECCAAVMDILQPTADNPIILNLPATVEAATRSEEHTSELQSLMRISNAGFCL